MEVWKDIEGFNGYYQVSNYGRFKSIFRYLDKNRKNKEKILSQRLRKDGYLQINFWHKTYASHRVVALAFIPNLLNKKDVNHKDTNPLNNNASNLEWVTHCENMTHAWDHGLFSIHNGETNYNAKLKNEDVLFIRSTPLKAKIVAKIFGVTINCVYSIRSGHSWRHI